MGGSLETFVKTNLFSVEKEVSNFNDIYSAARTASEPHLPQASTFHNPPTTQDIFWPLPGLISCPGRPRDGESYLLQERQWWASTLTPTPCKRGSGGPLPSLPPPAREAVAGLIHEVPSLPPLAQLSAQVCGMQVPTFIEMTAIST